MTTRATRWTDEKLKAQRLPDGSHERRLLVEPGLYLYLRQRSDGHVAKQWQYRAQVAGKRRWLSLGSFPEVGLAKAGDERRAHDRVHEAAKKGEADHPVIVARQKRQAAMAQPSVDEVFEEMIADKKMGSARKGGKPVRESTIAVLRENYDGDIKPRLAEAKIAKTTRADWQACIDAPRRRGSPSTDVARQFAREHALLQMADRFADQFQAVSDSKEAILALLFRTFPELPKARVALEYISSTTGTRQTQIP